MARTGIDALQFLLNWYDRQCNGEWEKVNGITIETLASRGWLVTIDLLETPLENQAMSPVRHERSNTDWILCEVEHGKFHGEGDSQKLGEILLVFEKWVNAQAAGGRSR
jgi:hypothetical protein